MAMHIDGAMGEGGGQVVRSSLTLSMLTGEGIRLTKIRAGRRKPGLLRQHLTAAKAAAKISGGQLHGARLGARELRFTPGQVRGGDYHFAIGSAGSAMLVLQTVLPALCLADGPSRLELEGGTHNPWAPPFDFLERCYLPLLERMGPKVRMHLERPGFYPAGGGRVRVDVEPVERFRPLHLPERGEVLERRAVAMVSNLSAAIADRELREVKKLLGWRADQLETREVHGALGPGNVLGLEIRSEHVTEIFTGFGRVQTPAKKIAGEACREAREYLAAGVPVGKHLADQLLLPLAVAGEGSFRTLAPSRHTLTHIDLIRRLTEIEIDAKKEPGGTWALTVGRADSQAPEEEGENDES